MKIVQGKACNVAYMGNCADKRNGAQGCEIQHRDGEGSWGGIELIGQRVVQAFHSFRAKCTGEDLIFYVACAGAGGTCYPSPTLFLLLGGGPI